MRKLLILLAISIMIGIVYYCFVFVQEKAEKEAKDMPETKYIKQNLNTIDRAYNIYCSSYIKNLEYKITMNVASEIPTKIDDPNFTSARKMPNSVDIDLNEKGEIIKGTLTFDNMICEYENEKITIKRAQ